MNLTMHFTLEELTATSHRQFDNTPPDALLPALTRTAAGLEKIRALLCVPVHVNSGYRSPEVNKAVGSKPTSQHCRGEAADIIAPEYGTPLEVAKKLLPHLAEFGVDQMIFEFGQWVHVSFTASPRHSVLTIDAKGTREGLG